MVSMKQIAAKVALMMTCKDIVSDACDPGKFSKLGLESQVMIYVQQDLIMKKVDSLYGRIFEKVRKSMHNRSQEIV